MVVPSRIRQPKRRKTKIIAPTIIKGRHQGTSPSRLRSIRSTRGFLITSTLLVEGALGKCGKSS